MLPKINKYISAFMLMMISSCMGIKNLPKGEKLYTGAEIRLESSDKIKQKEKHFIKNTIQNSIRPRPNKSFLELRPKLVAYQMGGDHHSNKFTKWLQKYGEPPVLISSVKPTSNAAIIDARLFNIGIFKSYTEFKIIEKRHTAKIIYISHIHSPYTISDLLYRITDNRINEIIETGKRKSMIYSGDDYNLDKLKSERIRIDALLKDNGYFYFDPDYLIFKADTSEINHTVLLRLTIKDSVPKNALIPYRINNVFIDQEYSINENPERAHDTLKYKNNYFVGKESEMKIRPKVILKSVYLKKFEPYSRKNHVITLNRLMTMGNFKFIRINFYDSDTLFPGFLDVTILMTPMPKRTLRTESDIITKSNNYTGPRLNLSYLNRNVFNGAELLDLNMAGSYEAQLSGKNKNLFSYSLNPQIELYFPNFLVPFPIRKTTGKYVPKTKFSISYNYMRRVNYFDMGTFQFIYGFKWKENIKKEHELNPINISNTSIKNKSAVFSELLSTNPFLKKSYEEQFIAGGTYSFTYNDQVTGDQKMQYFLQITAESSGNSFSLLKSITGEKISSDKPSTVIGSVYSQYSRLSVDGRNYYTFNNKNKLVLRLYTGAGKPYGNSSTLPYTKQFFSGGPNSIRAFHINSIGPGTFHQNISNQGFLQLGGDVKLETNAEYRFNIIKLFKGALFIDAGNMWLLKSNPSNYSGIFSISSFYNEIAVGAGVGIRLDVSFFILRFDVATPLRKPWLPQNERWVIDEINIKNPSWRSENLILNVAIGYPF